MSVVFCFVFSCEVCVRVWESYFLFNPIASHLDDINMYVGIISFMRGRQKGAPLLTGVLLDIIDNITLTAALRVPSCRYESEAYRARALV